MALGSERSGAVLCCAAPPAPAGAQTPAPRDVLTLTRASRRRRCGNPLPARRLPSGTRRPAAGAD